MNKVIIGTIILAVGIVAYATIANGQTAGRTVETVDDKVVETVSQPDTTKTYTKDDKETLESKLLTLQADLDFENMRHTKIVNRINAEITATQSIITELNKLR